MSFILDALKKSETERQQQGAAEFAGVPTTSGPAGAPRWLWILGLLLAVNLAVLLGLILRPDASPQGVSTPAATSNEASFVERVAEARQNTPSRQEIAPEPEVRVAEAEPQPEARYDAAPEPEPQRVAAVSIAEPVRSNEAALPTFIEVVTSGTLVLPDLHLDIHVYSEIPEDRFVFINMSKQREQSQLSEGPVVQEITPNGVVLAYRGTSFLLPRD